MSQMCDIFCHTCHRCVTISHKYHLYRVDGLKPYFLIPVSPGKMTHAKNRNFEFWFFPCVILLEVSDQRAVTVSQVTGYAIQ